MAIEPPYSVSPAPPAPQRTQPPAVFAERADPFVTYIAGLSVQMNAATANVNNNALETYELTVLAASIRDATQAIADEALRASRRETQRATWAADDAEDYAAGALQQAQMAAASAAGAQASAAAAGAAAGLPAFAGKGGFPARVRADEQGIEYVPGGAQFTLTTSQTWPKPVWASWVYVECISGGDGGAGLIQAGTDSVVIGGNGGRFVSGWFRAADLPASISCVVGNGGLGAIHFGSTNPQNRSRTAGGSSSFGSFLASPAGTASGITSPSSASLLYAQSGYDGGQGGHSAGAAGSTVNGGAGGGSAGPSNGNSPGGTSINGGAGGAGIAATTTVSPAVASNGVAPGGGGGGAKSQTSTGSSLGAFGGDGGRGEIRIRVF